MKVIVKNDVLYACFEHRRTIDGEESVLLAIAPGDEDIVSSCSLRMVPEAEHALVTNLFTSDRHRKRGLATWLLNRAGEIAREYHMLRLTLTVHPQNFEIAAPFYRHNGFEVVYRFADGESIFARTITAP